jgi:tRNA (guanosine-2'-O-)-methyltransferase
MPARQENHTDPFSKLTFEQKQRLYDAASELFSENKQELFNRLALNRTRHITVVLEDIFQSHNASAVLRSCDCFGVQDVHVVEKRNEYSISPEVAMGSNKWVDYYLHHDILHTYDLLHKKGYRIVATTPHENDSLLPDLDITQPTALVFGTELTGLTDIAIQHADAYMKIPMYGFTESFNISVCAALSLFSLTEKMRRTPHLPWQMSQEEQITLKLHWASQVIKDGYEVLDHLMKTLPL